MKTPLVSIVMATFNRADLLPEAVESVLRQEYDRWELLVVDDGSTDQTEAALARFGHDRRVSYLRQERKGQAAARNLGLQNARGMWIAFLDSDDRWLPHKLRVHLACLDSNPDIDVLYGEEEPLDLDGQPLSMPEPMRTYSGDVWRELLIDNFVPFSASMVRAETARAIGGFDESIRRADDYDFWLRIALTARFKFLPGVIAQYRVAGDRISDNIRGRYESNMATVERFLAANPKLLTQAEANEVRARVHSRFARGYAEAGSIAEGMKHAGSALKLTPGSISTWRTLAAVALQPARSRFGGLLKN